MRRRYPIPTLWLFTDERIGDALWPALRRLPRGAGVIVRHHGLPPGERRALWRRLRRIALARDLVLVRAGATSLGYGEAGVHGWTGATRPGLRTVGVHDRRELARAARSRIDAVFVSPVFTTRSHTGARPLGPQAAGRLARAAPMPALALGGMDSRRARRLAPLGLSGWAAIDAWIRD